MTDDESQQRVVLVTGAASGIGAALCRRIAGPGARMLLHSRKNRDGLDAVARAVRDAGGEAEIQLGDLADPSVAPLLVAKSIDRFGRLDQVVANAGFADRRTFGEVDLDGLVRAERTMPDAFFQLVDAALPSLEASGWGRVVAVSSFVAHVFAADALFPASAAAKAAVEALARSLAAQIAAKGVTVNCVVPGFTRKDASGHSALSPEAWRRSVAKVPMGRIGEPDDAAALIQFLLSRDAGFITGQCIHVDGGLTLA